MNQHIVIGADNKCFCGIFEGRPIHCSDILESISTIEKHGQSWDGGLLARLLKTLVIDVDSIACNASKPVGDLGETLESIKNRFKLADPDTEFRQDQLLKAIEDAFLAGQSSSEDSKRLDWLDACRHGIIEPPENFPSLDLSFRQAIDAAMKGNPQ